MQTIHSPNDLIIESKEKYSNKSIAFVPTMGNLHTGHTSLIELANDIADITIVSIYINPLQFSENEDFKDYPRTLENDKALLKKLNVDILFLPTSDTIFVHDQHTLLQIPHLSFLYCGKSRPQFFTGILTIVMKLLQIVQPNFLILGEKDFQQQFLIKQMIHDFFLPTTVLTGKIIRDQQGLALSSRNSFFDSKQKKEAICLFNALQSCVSDFKASQYDLDKILEIENKALNSLATQDHLTTDYIKICDATTLLAPTNTTDQFVTLGAVWFFGVRLIDNITFNT